ncbi:MAG: YfhO family protein, partial [Chloroflexota bacterium]
AHTARTGLSFDAKGNGFPIQDVVQFVFTNVVSQWSPLYIGIAGLALAGIALWRRLPESVFWGVVALVALGLSFGKNSPIYAFFYNVLPGLRFFRGQERGAFLITFSLALLAGMGAAHLIRWEKLQDFKATRLIQQIMLGLVGLCGIVLIFVMVAWLGNHDAYGMYIQPVALSLLLAVLTLVLIRWLLDAPQSVVRQALLAGLLVLDLFTLSMDNRFNYDPIPPQKQLDFNPPAMVATALADTNVPFRVDGYRVLNDNYGGLYDVADMRGISPLFLEGPNAIINGNLINPVAWELFAVRYVYTDWEQMPVASTIIASGEDRYGKVNMHQITDPRPFATLVYDTRMVSNDAEALAALNDTGINLRRTVILEQSPNITVSGDKPSDASATVTTFKPETFTIGVKTSANAVLSIAHPDYPGWIATLDGTTTPILRAYGALAAVVVPAGDHTIIFKYDPLSYKLGAIISLLAWLSVIVLGGISIYRGKTHAK